MLNLLRRIARQRTAEAEPEPPRPGESVREWLADPDPALQLRRPHAGVSDDWDWARERR